MDGQIFCHQYIYIALVNILRILKQQHKHTEKDTCLCLHDKDYSLNQTDERESPQEA